MISVFNADKMDGGSQLVSSVNTSTAENADANELRKTAVEKAVRALISLASSATEADKVVRKFNPDLDGEDTVSLLESKYNYVSNLFGVNRKTRAACNPSAATPFDIAVTNYYSLLSVLILRKWG